MSILKVVNLWAGPGAGKSTTAAAVFNLMKRERFEVELVTEVAKALTYDKAMSKLSNQLLVLAKQEHQLRRLQGQCEWAIVDSPFPMGTLYTDSKWSARLLPLIDAMWEDYENHSFVLQRTSKKFQAYGRNQTLDEAVALDAKIAELAIDFGAGEYPVMDADDPAVEYRVLECLGLRDHPL